MDETGAGYGMSTSVSYDDIFFNDKIAVQKIKHRTLFLILRLTDPSETVHFRLAK